MKAAAARWLYFGARLGALVTSVTGCISVPPIHHYALARPPEGTIQSVSDRSGPIVAVEELAADAPYEESAIVYRPDPHRIERYHYHLWGAPPSQLVSDYLRESLAVSGCFRAVLDEVHPETAGVLTGRLTAFEEIDVSESRWRGRLAVELRLIEPTTGELLWTRRFREEVPLEQQSPAGLAAALGVALDRVVARVTPEIRSVLGGGSARGACGDPSVAVTSP